MTPTPDIGATSAPLTLDELFRSNPELSRTDLEYLQDWMSKQPHLPILTDEQLVPFLHSNYYSLESAKRTVENYFTIRTHAVDLFQNRDPLSPEVQTQYDLFYISTLGKRDYRGYKVMAGHLHNHDPAEYQFPALVKSVFMMVDQAIKEDPTCPGYVFVIDLTGISMGHVVKASLTTIKMGLAYVQDALPLRMKAVHILNVTPVLDAIMMLIKPFLHGELLSLLHFHSGAMEEFYKEFPKDMLPKECGGDLGSLKEMHAHTLKKLEANRDWILQKDKLLVDETRRPGKAMNAGDIFGMEGSFKKLDID